VLLLFLFVLVHAQVRWHLDALGFQELLHSLFDRHLEGSFLIHGCRLIIVEPIVQGLGVFTQDYSILKFPHLLGASLDLFALVSSARHVHFRA